MTNVINLSQNGADGTYATDGYMGFSFRADDPNDMNTFDYELALSGVTGTIIINTRTLVAVPNQVPTANAGPDQTVASGASVTLDGSASSDTEVQPLSYAWSQTGGTTMTLSSTSAGQPTFTAPILGWNAADEVLTFSLTVNDSVNTSVANMVQISVTAPIDVTDTTVTLAGIPASVMPGEIVAISVSFSEAVTGLDASDFTVVNGSATGLTGSGDTYTLSVTATGGEVLGVSLAADMAVDVADNGNLVLNTLTAEPGAIAQFEEKIAKYLADRANALVGAQPDLIRLLDPESKTQVTASTMGASLATGGSTPIWASLHGQWGESGASKTRFLLGAVGGHLWLNDRTILGLMHEVDQMNEDDPLVSIKGTGWLLGPYLAGQVQDQPLFYETRLLWGKTDNDIAQSGQPTASFGSTRFLAQAKLKGEVAMGKAVAAPFLDASYVRDQSGAYSDGLNNPIAAQEVQQSQDGLTEPAHDGWRGKLNLGLTFTHGLSQFEAQTFVDGLGTPDYRNYGLSFDFLTRF